MRAAVCTAYGPPEVLQIRTVADPRPRNKEVCWPSSALALRPANRSYEESAAIPYGGLIASFFVRRLGVRKGRRLLVYGASGAIGTSAVQLAVQLGADVTGVCSTVNLELV